MSGSMPEATKALAADCGTTSRALVPSTPASRDDGCRNISRPPSAAFLAQLIAVKCHLPQARERRRAEPREAIAAYMATARAA